MRRSRLPFVTVVAFVFTLVLAPVARPALKCPGDSVAVGTVCVDKYEASVWLIPPSNKVLVKKVQSGKVSLADLTKAGAVHLGCTEVLFDQTAYPANFPNNGNWTPILGSSPPSPGVYAVSIPGVLPSSCISWFQANQACRLSGKRLARNADWQAAAQGTPDPGTDNGMADCAVNSLGPVNTGSRASCKSSWGLFDMVGNVDEWVEEWADNNGLSPCTDWTTSNGIAGGDYSCFGGPGGSNANAIPAALFRGGDWDNAATAGVFTVDAHRVPSYSFNFIGFRCAR